LLHRTLKIITKFTTQNKKSKKANQILFYPDNFVLPFESLNFTTHHPRRHRDNTGRIVFFERLKMWKIARDGTRFVPGLRFVEANQTEQG
jgi:hypothetical protein